jgi:hypothetical protein
MFDAMGVEIPGTNVMHRFAQDSNDSSWISSLPRAATPPPRVTSASPQIPSKPSTPSLPSAASGDGSPSMNRPDRLLQEKINQLETLNTNLRAEVKQLKELLEGAQRSAWQVYGRLIFYSSASKKTESLLAEEQKRADNWHKKYSDLEKQKDSALAAEAKRLQDALEGRSCMCMGKLI